MHACEGEMVCESINPKIPYFNAPIYLENKVILKEKPLQRLSPTNLAVQTSIGKVDEILGPLNQVFFTVKPQEGIVATSFKTGDKVYIGGDRLLPLDRFLPKPKPPPGAPKPKRAGGASRGGPMRGRGAPRGFSRGGPRGGGRGGFGDRGGRGGSRGFSRGGSSGGRGGFGSRGGGSRGRGSY